MRLAGPRVDDKDHAPRDLAYRASPDLLRRFRIADCVQQPAGGEARADSHNRPGQHVARIVDAGVNARVGHCRRECAERHGQRGELGRDRGGECERRCGVPRWE